MIADVAQQEFQKMLALGSERAVADMIVNVVGRDPARFAQLLDFCYPEKYPISMRAARAVQLCCEKDPYLLHPHLDRVIRLIMETRIDGVKRNFLKILAQFIDINQVSDPGPLLSTCFDWLSDARENPATRIHCMEIVMRVGKKEPDLLHELKYILEYLPDENPPSIQSKKRHLLKKLRKDLRF